MSSLSTLRCCLCCCCYSPSGLTCLVLGSTSHYGVTYPHRHPQARSIDLDTQLKPFIPDYIPSVGSIDEFIKVPRPDAKPDYLGLKVRPMRVCDQP